MDCADPTFPPEPADEKQHAPWSADYGPARVLDANDEAFRKLLETLA